MKLIKEYTDVETVLANIDKVSGKSLKTKLSEHQEEALLSKKLATIYTDAPVDLSMSAYELAPLKRGGTYCITGFRIP